MSKFRTKHLEQLSDDDLLLLVRSLSDEIDEKVRAFKSCKDLLEDRGWQFVNWPDYEKTAS